MTTMNRTPEELKTMDLPAVVDHLLPMDGMDVDALFEEDEARRELFTRISRCCDRAYKHNDPYSEFQVQNTLYKIYNLHTMLPNPTEVNAESSYVLTGVRNIIERRFIEIEDQRVPEVTMQSIPADPRDYSDWVLELVHSHPARVHPLYEEYLGKHATDDDLRYFLVQESTIDASTDDFLALVQVGTERGVKLEIASNYWDEMGNGDETKIHSVLFSQAISSLELETPAESSSFEVEALVCGNLQVMLSLRRRHFYKAVGYFGVVEYMAPERFKKLMEAWKRNNLKASGATYHEVHITVDVEHAKGWFENVIDPLVARYPEAMADITRGAVYRLNTSKRYLDKVLPRFPSKLRKPNRPEAGLR